MIEKSSSETLIRNRYQLKNHLRKRSNRTNSGVPSWRTIESTTIQQSGQVSAYICIPFSRLDCICIYLYNYADTDYQPWEDISHDELQTALKKTNNWKSPGPDVFPNFWLKQLTTLHHHLLYNQVIENPENLPDWFTTAQTYLLPKNRHTESLM